MFFAYLITCRINGKGYVGITSRSVEQRWSDHLRDARDSKHKMAITRAIAKHGAHNFEIETLASAKSWPDICAVERVLIVQHDTRGMRGYNISDGGAGPFGVVRTPESVERSAAKHRGKPCHPNTREAGSRTHKDVPKSPEHRNKIASALFGGHRSAETKAKISAYWAARRAAGAFKTAKPYEHAAKADRDA